MKISEIIERVENWHPPLEHPEHTADTVKIGDPDQECTGIAVTCFASVDVVKKAKELGANFIICHEPLFYGDQPNTDWLGGDAVYTEKRKMLEEAGIVVWRDHDRIHGPGGPMAEVHPERDYIYYGLMKELGWDEYVEGEETKPLLFNIPPRTVEELANELIEKFGLTGARIVGDPGATARKVFLCEHINGRPGDEKAIRKAAGADVMIPLEIVDWSLSAYIRDAAQLGKGKAIIEMGHFNTEELGMLHMTRWLPEVIENAAPVHYVQSGDAFSYIAK